MGEFYTMLVRLLKFMIVCYQNTFSLYFGPCCRFYPSCSEYAKDAFAQHGICKGFVLTLVRLLKCNPLFKGGIDMVPCENLEKEKKL